MTVCRIAIIPRIAMMGWWFGPPGPLQHYAHFLFYPLLLTTRRPGPAIVRSTTRARTPVRDQQHDDGVTPGVAATASLRGATGGPAEIIPYFFLWDDDEAEKYAKVLSPGEM